MNQDTKRFSQLSPLKRAFLALEEMQTKLKQVEDSQTEPIAIIGMGCRFPGGANDPEAFWQLLRNGVNAIEEVPENRWDINAYYDGNPETPGKISTRSAGFLQSEVDKFDAHFFGISPREAISIDPQQRMLLEVSWETIENAGIAPSSLMKSKTGVFVGINASDYAQMQLRDNDTSNLNAYSFTGTTFSVAAGRLSYMLGLQGPNLAIDTACSSSLVSVHLACQSLRSKECNLALAGGVNLMLAPQTSVVLSKMRALAPDGRCKTFDAGADGYGRGEGCGIVLLKRLSDAEKDGDNILALIRGSAINHDGPSSGLTVPNGLAQQELIRAALANAKVEPNQISYVEVHGTGTALGDPIEVEALGAVLGEKRSQSQSVMLGSVKPDIGHLEAAAGIAGLIKVVLMLQHREILPQRHLNTLNPVISWDSIPVTIPTEPIPWNIGKEQQRLAGLSSFGMSGTNGHIILEEASPARSVSTNLKRPVHLLTLSAKTETALKKLTAHYIQYFESHRDLALEDICFTANTGRSHFPHRLAMVAASLDEVREKLIAVANDQTTPEAIARPEEVGKQQKVVFMFTGQGSQYVNMGRQLYETQPTFRATLDRCNEILRPYLDKPLLEVLYPQEAEEDCSASALLNQTAYTQPALFALEYALAKLWQSWAIQPAIVMGHSVGEYVAACIAGVFSLEDGLKLIAERGRLMQALPAEGEMVAVFANEAEIAAVIEPYSKEVAIAAINGPQNIVISGTKQAVKKVVTALEKEGVEYRQLKVSHAFHSPLMEPMLAAFDRVAAQISYGKPRIPILSNLTGEVATEEITTPGYWCRHVRQPVKFAASMTNLHLKGYELFLEIGAKPTLLGMGRYCLPAGEGVWLPSLRPERTDWQQLLQSLRDLYLRGVPVDWSGFDRDYARRKVILPTYPFERQRYWFDEVDQEKNAIASSLTCSLTESVQTPIVNLLQQEDIQHLVQQLETAGNFSDSEIKLLPKVSKVLVEQHQQQVRAATVKNWFYQLEWQAKPRLSEPGRDKTQLREGGSWLIFADRGGVGKDLAKLLQQQKQHFLLVYPGETYKTLESGIWQLNPSKLEEFEGLFQEVLTKNDLSLKGIIYLWSLDVFPPEKLSSSNLESAQRLVCGSVLHLVQALAKYQKSVLPQLWLLTRGAMSVKQHDPVAVAQASLWGLGKVIAEEHPEFWGGIVDLDPLAPSDEVTTLLNELRDSQGENNLAFREGQRYARRLVRSPQIEESSSLPLQSDGTYLITGGLGALGLKFAQRLAELGAGHLVLISRRVASPETEKTLAQIKEAGVQVTVAQADVSQQEDVLRVLQKIKTDLPPLRGIIHTAGVLRDGVLVGQNWENFVQVMKPKVQGAWNLHSLTQDVSLDFFILCSSATSFFGSPGQGNYAAANAFLDALAHYRQAKGLSGLSINWGPWAEVGMTARMDSRDRDRLSARGLELMKPDYGVQALEQLISQSPAQVGVFSIHWSDWLRQYPSHALPSYYESIAREVKQASATDETTQQENSIFEQLLEKSSAQREAMLTSYLQQQVAQVLQLDGELPSIEENLVERGMDSLMVMEGMNQIQQDLQLMLYPREFYERPRLKDLAQYLLAEFEQVHGSLLSEPEPDLVSPEQAIADFRAVVDNLPLQPDSKPPVFLLSGPRSGSTLLRVMLAGHSELFSPPELHLLPFKHMAERQEELALSYFGEGLQRALMEIMEIDSSASQAILDEMVSENYSIQQVYSILQQLAGSRQLVDKSPTYAMSRETLARAEQLFKGAKYIYLARHPYAAIESFARMRMDKLIDAHNSTPYQVAEKIWSTTNQNILDFLQHSVEPTRYHQVRYEELVKQPQAVMEGLCEFLQIPFEENLMQPYEGKRMTNGIHAKSMPIGDPNFAKHDGVDHKLAETWKTIKLPHPLKESTLEIAKQLQYELPAVDKTQVESKLKVVSGENKTSFNTTSSQLLAMGESFVDIRGHRLCLCEWGDKDKPLVLCLHGILEQGAAWSEVALPLVKMGYWVVAPDLRGHGRSTHLDRGNVSLIDLLADIDVLAKKLTDQPFTLVGHSMGSIIAVMLASTRSPKVKSLVLVETVLPSSHQDTEITSQLTTHLDYLVSPPQHPIFPDIATAATRLREATPTMSAELSLQLAQRITEPCSDGVRWRWDPLLRTRTLMNSCGFAITKAQYLELLRQIQAPITLVYGELSNFNRQNDLSEQKAAMPKAQRIVLSGGHNLQIDTPEALAKTIVEATHLQDK